MIIIKRPQPGHGVSNFITTQLTYHTQSTMGDVDDQQVVVVVAVVDDGMSMVGLTLFDELEANTISADLTMDKSVDEQIHDATTAGAHFVVVLDKDTMTIHTVDDCSTQTTTRETCTKTLKTLLGREDEEDEKKKTKMSDWADECNPLSKLIGTTFTASDECTILESAVLTKSEVPGDDDRHRKPCPVLLKGDRKCPDRSCEFDHNCPDLKNGGEYCKDYENCFFYHDNMDAAKMCPTVAYDDTPYITCKKGSHCKYSHNVMCRYRNSCRNDKCKYPHDSRRRKPCQSCEENWCKSLVCDPCRKRPLEGEERHVQELIAREFANSAAAAKNRPQKHGKGKKHNKVVMSKALSNLFDALDDDDDEEEEEE